MTEHPSGSSRRDDFGWSMALFFLALAGVLLLIHFLQPPGQETTSSSRSPTHQTTE
jgi:hypothetical protein